MGKVINSKRRTVKKTPILVVEDSADHWLIIRSALAQCFPEVEPVWMNHADQTLAYLENVMPDQSKRPGLILQDLCLPGRQEGWALLEAIKTHPVYRQIPVVILSHSQDPEDIGTAYSLGVASYLVKPITYQEWLACFYTFRRYWWESVSLPLHTV